MHALKAKRIAKAAGLNLDFDRELFNWAIHNGRQAVKRLSSGEFGRMTEAEFSRICHASAKPVFLN